MIEVTVKLYGVLRRQRPAAAEGAAHQAFEITLAEGAAVGDLMAELGIGRETVSAVAVNGESVDELTQLQNGDNVRLFPPSAGG